MKRGFVLPMCAAVLVIAAILVIVLVPKGNGTASTLTKNADGKYVISVGSVSSDKVSFLRVPGSGIELLARLGDDGTVSVALGTCQSCNGSPKAYYTQQGSTLQCNNCGLTFPLSVLDAPGGGCHPIMIDESLITRSGADVMIDADGLTAYEPLFEKVEKH